MISYAQNREDVVLERVFHDVDRGFYIDAGAGHPVFESVTKHFYDRGWHGVNIEPRPEFAAKLRDERPRDRNLEVGLSDSEGSATLFEGPTTGLGLSTFDPAVVAATGGAPRRETVCQLATLRQVCADIDGPVHFLKIDVEGWEQRVLAGADFEAVRPMVVVVEATRPGMREPSHEAWEPILLDASYRFVYFDGLNRFYVAEEEHERLAPRLTPATPLDDFEPHLEMHYRERLTALERASASPAGRRAARWQSTAAANDLTSEAAQVFLDSSSFHWHQRIELAPGVFSPGVNDVAGLLQLAEFPLDLKGKTVLDIGTTNGGVALEAERRGADRVVAIDIVSPEVFGIQQILDFLGSRVEFVQTSVYEIPEALAEQFDYVVFWGVLYHLRHPLLALDKVRAVTREFVFIETAVADDSLRVAAGDRLIVEFFRLGELADDPTNWFAPTVATLEAFVRSTGFEPITTLSWPIEAPTRSMVSARVKPGVPEWRQVSYERLLRASVVDDLGGEPWV